MGIQGASSWNHTVKLLTLNRIVLMKYVPNNKNKWTIFISWGTTTKHLKTEKSIQNEQQKILQEIWQRNKHKITYL
jgi:hypothetical protein